MNNIEYTISRYELIPKNAPEQLVVRISVKDLETGEFSFFETLLDINLIVSKTKAEVCQLAYSNLSKEIADFLVQLEKNRESIIGFKFIPNA
jgi:hypothetical protein